MALAQRDVDVAIIGAGTAGIAAARVLVRAGLSVLVLEASSRLGGRCFTDTITFNAPFDHGAHWLHAADKNPLVKFGHDLGFALYEDQRTLKLAAPDRLPSEDETTAYRNAVETGEASIIAAAERGDDGAAAASLPREPAEWRQAVSFRLGAFDIGRPLSEVSILDFGRVASGPDLLCRTGLGTLIATLGRGLPIAFNAAVSAITAGDEGVRIETAQGTLNARIAIVTVATDVIAKGMIAFTPALDAQQTAAFQTLKLSDFLHIGFEIANGVVDIADDTHVFSAVRDERTFAALARSGGSDVWYVATGGIFARELEAAGKETVVSYARDWLISHFGSDIGPAIRRDAATLWGRNPYIGGAWSVAPPGQARARTALREWHAGRVRFAGEAGHDTMWGTVGGAWESGQEAARQALTIVRG
ncbi:MAG: FAD-dependent oxidoreductase [Hyphomicrobiales bacterium]|nr:FAD-dependent oxidoreductase [Hyphomicrobiales bacterium]OQW81570.1 MAG: hypothetical protein BVN31_10790 [Proteobacteria bacterium ST_bin15]